MKSIKEFFSTLTPGWIIGSVTSLIMVLTAVLYAAFYAGNSGLMDNMSWESFAALLSCGLISCALMFFKKGAFAAPVHIVGSLVGFTYYVMKIFKYVSAAATGIDSTWEPQFFILTIFIIASIVLSFVTLFMLFPCDFREVFQKKEESEQK